MRIFTDATTDYINKLAATLLKDPASLESWRCVHCPVSEHCDTLVRHELSIRELKQNCQEIDADVVFCEDGDILIISRTLDKTSLIDLMDIAMSGYETKIDYAFYDMFYEWRRVWFILSHKTRGFPPEIVQYQVSSHDEIGDTKALDEVFKAALNQRKARHPMHILLVEDDPFTRRAVANLFKDSYALITAGTAEEAVTNYLLYAPDIVFLDINLPDGDGFQVLRKIMAQDKDSYVVMFSGNSYLDNVTQALAEGAHGFIAKPFSKDKMRHYLEDCAVSRRKDDQA